MLPYHCLRRRGEKLLAASASSIDSFSLVDGKLTASWSCAAVERGDSQEAELDRAALADAPETSDANPAKRRKLDSNRGKQKGKQAEPETPFVSSLAVLRDGRHIVAITSEDKSIRVLQDTGKGIEQLSKRVMPKRPCAVAMTVDESSIISADKFGDVYSLPTFPTAEGLERMSLEATTAKSYKPSATVLTVHSQRNRQILEHQLRHAEEIHGQKQVRGPEFEHKLLLGHVAMLTDVAVGVYDGRPYILSADRDEHIRVSQSDPFAYVIETFCLGHQEFVSCLCLPESQPGLLISGGGDDEVYLWHWPTGEQLATADVRGHITPNEDEGRAKIAVSAISHVRSGDVDLIIIACEAVPTLVVFKIAERALVHLQTIQLDANPLALVGGDGSFILAVDSLREAGPSRTARKDTTEALQVFQWGEGAFSRADFHFETKPASSFSDAENARLEGMLYGIEKLRKRDGDDF